MPQNRSEVGFGVPKQMITFRLASAITATTDPLLRFYARTGMTPLSFRICPLTVFDRADGNETYTLSVRAGGVTISTANTPVTTAGNMLTAEATFAPGVRIAKDAVVELVVTLGGTTPSIPAGSLVTFEYLEG